MGEEWSICLLIDGAFSSAYIPARNGTSRHRQHLSKHRQVIENEVFVLCLPLRASGENGCRQAGLGCRGGRSDHSRIPSAAATAFRAECCEKVYIVSRTEENLEDVVKTHGQGIPLLAKLVPITQALQSAS